jgi:acetyl esterase/lipase
MLSRKDIRTKQVQHLIRHGILPVSVDYRLCPEVNIVDGPVRDVRDAFVWARTQLSSLKLYTSPYLRIDDSRVAVVGWSTGGTLALTLGWTPDVKAPDAILSFYCPTDYEDPCKCYAAIPFAGGEEYRTNLNSRLASTQLPQ